ncbi:MULTISPECIES: 50S ribosomal protein L30 [Salinicoccus]|jgi:large subunit ribosomal protein L30|uniref:Large ribosomal subunit protein uL30 n=2 Tax=Salinicoccus TaxID=45669 RepID=A0A0C2E7D8_9STAP|nr:MULTISPECIES: 50S ribosomal protein L30 [Salinicoccus]KIH71217.1 50S ribosomal protein L30 [Salinicoccus roseus]MBY8909572.1 50S ribosomal protein L30 [Salinicoccus roseus]MCC4723739.1 50S ribosomal protein L30 [Salinicoccus sp. RF5]MCG7331438.1 50S ribosomal protein L30 [Salinicoccus roseus]MDB0579947.1 50S ribosomal protein L30 [Salinicoccus roseus]|tara:strand:- start:285 stop:464 length:180 start_codon:yes stop_codon:yes gene_type:complete
MAKVKITLKKSLIGRSETQRRTVASLGLRKLQQSVELEDTPQLRGQVEKVSHLVSVEEK